MAMQNCDQTCYWCATNWWEWLKAREGQMSTPRKNRKFSVTNPDGSFTVKKVPVTETVTFKEAAATSVWVVNRTE